MLERRVDSVRCLDLSRERQTCNLLSSTPTCTVHWSNWGCLLFRGQWTLGSNATLCSPEISSYVLDRNFGKVTCSNHIARSSQELLQIEVNLWHWWVSKASTLPRNATAYPLQHSSTWPAPALWTPPVDTPSTTIYHSLTLTHLPQAACILCRSSLEAPL